jgi:predicted metal-dependent HD superfamily phosphohydrolase
MAAMQTPTGVTPVQPPATGPTARAGDLAQHYKGGLYRIEGVATLEATGEPAVIYRPLADPARAAWVRAQSVFDEPVEGLDGLPRPRFAVLRLHDDRALRTAAATAGLPEPMVEGALARYAEAGRHYHATWHPLDLFGRAACDGQALSRAQVLALLFHDAVYVPGAAAGTNETLSAMTLQQAAHGVGLIAPDELALACNIVRDTASHRASVPESSAVIALDLATLGDDPIRFDAWTELVWLEYRHLFAAEPDPKAAFMRRRVRVLGALLQAGADQPMPPGFHERFAANLERLARRLGP